MKKVRLNCVALLGVAFLWGCGDDSSIIDPGGGDPTNTATCIGCHSSEEELKMALGGAEPKVKPITTSGDG